MQIFKTLGINKEFIEKEKYTIVVVIVILLFLMITPFLVYPISSAFQIFINGAINASILAATSLGFSLIFGVAKQFKLSLGGYYLLGAYGMFFLLETLNIGFSDVNFTNLDGISFFLLIFAPLIITILVSFYFLVTYRYKYSDNSTLFKLVLIFAPFITLIGIFLITRVFTYGFYTGLTVTVLILAGLYLEIDKLYLTWSVLLISFLIPILYIFLPIFGMNRFTIIYLSIMIIAVAFTAGVAMFSDRYLLDKIRHNDVSVLIITFALAIVFQSIVQLTYFPKNGSIFEPFGITTHPLATIVPKNQIFTFPFIDASVLSVKLFAFIITILAIGSLVMFLKYSKLGLAIQAVSQDEEAAALSGINIRKITAIVSGLGMGLVALAAILTSPFAAFPIWNPSMGWNILIFAIVVVTLGGTGSIGGTLTASVLLGYVSSYVGSLNLDFPIFLPVLFEDAPFILTLDSSYSVLVPLVVVLIVMIIKPRGLFGKEEELE